MTDNNGFSWHISLKKFFVGLGISIIPIILLFTIGFLETEEFPEKYMLYLPVIIGLLHATLNAVKHYKDK